MPIVVALLLGTALAVTMVLHAGIYYPALALPGYFAVAVAGLMVLVVWLQNRGRSVDGTAFWIGLAALGYLLARAAFSQDVGAARQQELFLLAALAGFGAVAVGLASWRSRAVFLLLIFGLALVQMGVALWESQVDAAFRAVPWASESLRVWYEDRVGATRQRGLYLNANHLSWLLNAGGLIGLGFAFWSRWPMIPRLLVGALGFALLAGTVVLTVSRGGVVAALGGLMVFGLVSFLLFVRKWSLMRIILAVTFLVLFGGGSLVVVRVFEDDPAMQQRMERGSEFQFRELLWRAGLRQAQLDPIFGTGAGSYESYFRRYREPGMDGTDAFFAHNDWVQLLAEYGLVGLILVCLAGGMICLSGLALVLRRSAEAGSVGLPLGDDTAVVTASLSVVAACAIHGFIDFNMQLPANGLLAVLVGACLIAPAWKSAGAARGFSIPGLVGVAAVLIFSGMLFSALHKVWAGEMLWLRGSNSLVQGRVTEAWRAGREAVRLDPANARAWQLLGEASLARSLQPMPPDNRDLILRQALNAFEHAAGINPGQRLYWLKTGESLARLGRGRQAEPFLVTALELEIFYSLAWSYLGGVAEFAGQYPFARRYYQVSVRLPGWTNYSNQRLRMLQNMVDRGIIPPFE